MFVSIISVFVVQTVSVVLILNVSSVGSVVSEIRLNRQPVVADDFSSITASISPSVFAMIHPEIVPPPSKILSIFAAEPQSIISSTPSHVLESPIYTSEAADVPVFVQVIGEDVESMKV